MAEDRKPVVSPVESTDKQKFGIRMVPTEARPGVETPADALVDETGDPDIVYSLEEEHVLHGNRPSASGAVTSGQKLP